MKFSTRLKSSFFVLFFLFLVLNSAAAVQFKKLNENQRLSSRRAYYTAKDNKGYIWVANMMGIDKYDGDKFYHYNFYPFNDYSKIKGVVADKNGLIYAFSEDFMYCYQIETDAFTQIKLNNKYKDGITDGITALYFDQNNDSWIATTKGLFYSKNKKEWTKIEGSTGYGLSCFVEDNNANVLIGTNRGVMSVSKGSQKKLQSINTKQSKYKFNKLVTSLYYDNKSKTLWAGTLSDGLFLIKPYSDGNVQILNISAPIRSISRVPNGEIWAGVDGMGIFSFESRNGKQIAHYGKEEANNNKIESNSILSIISIDSTAYISTMTAGTWYCDFSKNEDPVYKNQINNSNSLCNNYVNTILEDASGDLWFGTQAGLSQFSPRTKNWSHYLNNPIASNVVLALCEDNQHNIWVGGYASDLVYINKTSGKTRIISNPANKAKKYISSIIQDCDGSIWYGGAGTALTKHNPKTNSFKQFDINGIHKILEYNKDTILVASIFGLYIINKSTEKLNFVNFSRLSNNKKSIVPNINDLITDPKNHNRVWLGSNGGGLYRYDINKKSIRIFEVPGELASNYVGSIAKDTLNRLWISSENELNCFNLNTNKFEVSYEFNELPNSFINYLACGKCKNGDLIWGTPYGAIRINPTDIKNNRNPINLRFTAFNLFDQKLLVGTENSPLKATIDDTQDLKLNDSQRSFSFEFTNMHFTSNRKTLYSWKLSDFEKDWTRPSKEHKAIYTNVPAGEYTFFVKAINSENPKFNVTRSIHITIRPPFWASKLALTIYFLLIAGLLYFIFRFLKNKMEVKRSEEKIRFFVNMAHEVRTPITLVKAPLTDIERENLSDDGRSALHLAQRNLDKLFNTITQLLDFQKTESNAMLLMVEETNLKGFINDIIGNFNLLAKEKNIKLEVILPTEVTSAWIDQKKLSLCLNNLISNAVKYGKELGEITVKVNINERTLIIEVSDDGIGIPIKNQKNLFNRFFRAENALISNQVGSGIGLSLTQKLVQLQKGKISFESIENWGSTFIIEIPFLKEDFKTYEIILKKDKIETSESKDSKTVAKEINILLVEDNEEIRTYLSKQLKRDYNVVEAENGSIALEKIKADAPDFILSDIMMPGLTGLELCSILKNDIETSHIPIILLSALADRSDIVKGFNLGADDYITKPFDMSILELKIKTIIRNRVLIKNKFIDKTIVEEELSTFNLLDKIFMERVIKFVEENLMNENFSIDTLAQEMSMSRSVFFKKLKALTTNSPKDFIREIKMKKASDLLKEKKYQMYEIASLTGFQNSDYFSTAFKSYYGISPSKFMENKD
jgi:signal transduction histidine kinase/DNA-binding response OmpR family regulator/ligand-binding sensor domain-containing protein